MVIIFTKLDEEVERIPGLSFEALSFAIKELRICATPIPKASNSESISRALYRLPAIARPSAPACSRRKKYPVEIKKRFRAYTMPKRNDSWQKCSMHIFARCNTSRSSEDNEVSVSSCVYIKLKAISCFFALPSSLVVARAKNVASEMLKRSDARIL